MRRRTARISTKDSSYSRCINDNNNNNHDTVCATLLSMFEPRWKKPDAARLVQYTNGDLDLAVQEILRHDATGKSPMEWMAPDNLGSLGNEETITQQRSGSCDSDARTKKTSHNFGLNDIDTDLMGFLLSERGKNKDANSTTEDRKPSARNGESNRSRGPKNILLIPPEKGNNKPTVLRNCDSYSSLSASSECQTASHDSDNFRNNHQRPNLLTNHSTETQILPHQRETLHRFLESVGSGSRANESNQFTHTSRNDQISDQSTQIQHTQNFIPDPIIERNRDRILATLEIEKSQYENKIKEIEAKRKRLIMRNRAPPNDHVQSHFSRDTSVRRNSDGNLIHPSMVDELHQDNRLPKFQERTSTQAASDHPDDSHHMKTNSSTQMPHSIYQQQNKNIKTSANIYYRDKTLNPSDNSDVDDIDRAIEASLESNRAEIDESEQIKLALEESLKTKQQCSPDEIEDNELKLALAVSLRDTGTASNSRPQQHELYCSFQNDDSPSTSYMTPIPSLRASDSSRDSNNVTKPTVFQRSSTGSAIQQTSEVTGIVQGAGLSSVNGKYHLAGSCNGVAMYRKTGIWDGKPITFTLYRCLLDSGDRKWFISIVPDDIKPGTDEDRDFYAAPGTADPTKIENELPPEDGWITLAPYGRPAPPLCFFHGCSQAVSTTPFQNRVPNQLQTNGFVSNYIDAILVSDAGCIPINGTFVKIGMNDDAPMYVKETIWERKNVKVLLFRITLNRMTKRWLITIIPEERASPGSSMDIDLYYAQINPQDSTTNYKPPRKGWQCVNGIGIQPPPRCTPFCMDNTVSNYASSTNSCSSEDTAQIPQEICSHISSSDSKHLTNHRGTDSSNGQCLSHERIHVLDKNNILQTRRIVMCAVCKKSHVTYVLIPCGHACLCHECASLCQNEMMDWICPIARCPVHAIMRFYGTLVDSERNLS